MSRRLRSFFNAWLSFTAVSFCFLVGVSHAQEPLEKPRVVMAPPVIGASVSDSVRTHLDLEILTLEMEKALLGTRKFEVLTRNESQIRVILGEQELSGSSMSPGNAAAAGQIEAADYIVTPTVRTFRFLRGHSAVPNISDKWFRTDSGSLEVDVQIVDTASGQIKATFSMSDQFATGREIVNSRGGSPSKARYTTMTSTVAAEFAEQLVDAVFPMLIIGVQGTNVFLNRGDDGGLRQGEVLAVFRPGMQLIDPYTGEPLGSAETEIAAVRVVRVNPRFTIAAILADKTTDQPSEGDIVRRP